MPSGHKVRTSPKKKANKSNNRHHHHKKNKKKLTAQELLEAADQAMHVQDPVQALNLYTAAAAAAADKTSDLQLQLEILEKRASVKVSLSDQDGARQDYQECVNRIMIPDDDDDDKNNNNTSDSTIIVDLLERKAGLFLYMGQLSEGEDALSNYRNGIALLERALQARSKQAKEDDNNDNDDEPMQTTPTAIDDNSDDDDDNNNMVDEKHHPQPKSKTSRALLQETRHQLAAAYCTAAELYLTDLCFEENAEQDCEWYIQQALKLTDDDDDDGVGEPIIDALQAAASLRLSQNKGMEAVTYILRAFAQMQGGCEALASLVGMREANKPGEAMELAETEAVQQLPGFEFRCQTAKLFLECAAILKEQDDKDPRRTQCLQAAVDVLGSLMAENDEVVEIWSLAGDAFAALNPENPEVQSHYWERALEMLQGVKNSLEEQLREVTDEDEEEELNQELEEVLCQIDGTETKLKETL